MLLVRISYSNVFFAEITYPYIAYDWLQIGGRFCSTVDFFHIFRNFLFIEKSLSNNYQLKIFIVKPYSIMGFLLRNSWKNSSIIIYYIEKNFIINFSLKHCIKNGKLLFENSNSWGEFWSTYMISQENWTNSYPFSKEFPLLVKWDFNMQN